MKVFIICSKSFYKEIDRIKQKLESKGCEVILPILYNTPNAEREAIERGNIQLFIQQNLLRSRKAIVSADAVLCLNFEKAGIANYIGIGMYTELHEAFIASKKIFMYNYIPEGPMHDAIKAFNPIILKKRVGNIAQGNSGK